MKTLAQQLTQYAGYHRDRRNIACHFVGIPAIYLAVVILLSRPVFLTAWGLPVTPAVIVGIAALVYDLLLDRALGIAMVLLTALAWWGGAMLAAGPTSLWLGVGIGLFVVGWVVQFIGHGFEGRKPAFLDDLVGLLIGPLFVVAEAGFLLGLRPELKAEIERGVGPTRSGTPVGAVKL
ncbi:MAG TPA: Mpo1-like protein [Myxococcaceae bacterium]|jgi:uncharacterized membrane protein YGL010W